MVTSIHLLFLLSSHKNEEFYAKIETLNISDLGNKYISYVLLLNDAIEEGIAFLLYKETTEESSSSKRKVHLTISILSWTESHKLSELKSPKVLKRLMLNFPFLKPWKYSNLKMNPNSNNSSKDIVKVLKSRLSDGFSAEAKSCLKRPIQEESSSILMIWSWQPWTTLNNSKKLHDDDCCDWF